MVLNLEIGRRLSVSKSAAIALLALAPAALHAQPTAQSGGAQGGAPSSGVSEPIVQARYLTQSLTVDGRLDEPVYEEYPPTSAFIQQEPHEGEPVTEKTDVWIFYDDRNLYVGVRLWDSHPERILATEMRRDNGAISSHDESFAVVIDTFHDRRSGFLFITNPLGAMMDGSFVSEREYNGNFDPIWTPRSARFDKGWTIEIEIPFKSLRYGSSGEQVWGINFRRVVRWKNEVQHLTLMPASYGLFGINQVARAGTLVGVKTPATSKNLELKPYGISRLTTDRLASPPKNGQLDANGGVDLKYGITRGLTADFTYNTDFAQVEDDLQQVNLTRFPLFFPEKRDFFLEGQGIFNFGGNLDMSEGPLVFFSRRIGLENGQPVDIRAGGRLTGKAGRFSIGVLNIATAASSAANTPFTNFGVVRVKRDMFKRGSIGFIATQRAPSEGSNNEAFGADVNIGFGLTTINGFYARTHTPGLSGKNASYYGQYDYNADRYGLTAEHLTVEPAFRPEIGFLRRVDFRKEYGQVRFSPRPQHLPGIRKLYFEASMKYIADTAGTLQSRALIADARSDRNNGDVFAVFYERDYEFLPAPLVLQPPVAVPVGGYAFENVSGSYTFGPLWPVRGTVTVGTGTFYNGTRRQLSLSGGRIEPAHRMALEPSITQSWIELPSGRFRANVVSNRTTYSFSPRADVQALLQYNATANSLSSNVRFRWQYVPGSDLFVVYSDARTTLVPDRFADLQNRTILIKATRLFRY